MRNWRIISIVLILFPGSLAGRERTGQSFMFTRPIYRNIAAQRSLFDVFAAHKHGPMQAIFQIMPMFMQTLTSDKRARQAARYFFINRKSTLIVKGENAPNSAITRDVRAEWFQLSSDYDGTITIKPKQKQFGIWIEYQQDLKYFYDCWWLESVWLSLAIPMQYVKNDLQLEENVITPSSTPGLANMTEAFTRPDLKFGKIGPSKSRSSVSELMIKLGTNFLKRDGYNIYMYSLFSIPTARSQEPNFLFDPFLGQNRHFCWGSGVNFQLPLNDCVDEYVFAFFVELENIMHIRNGRKRILELKRKPWSRYLLLNKTDGTMNIPAANILTTKVKVQPFNYVDFASGFRWYNDSIEAEFGYSLWTHGSEELSIDKYIGAKFRHGEYGIAGVGTFVNEKGVTVGRTASKSTIDCLAPNDVDANGNPIFVPLLVRDLEFLKGAARTTLLHRGYMAIGYRLTNCNGVEGFVGLGGFIEIPSRNTSLAAWGLWFKGGLSI